MPTSCKSSSQRNATLAWWNHNSINGQTECSWQTGQGIFSFFVKALLSKKQKNGVWWVTLQLVLKTTLLVSHHIKKTRYLLQCVLLQLRSAFFPDSAQSTQTFTELFTLLAHASAGRGVGEARCLCLWLTRTLHAPGKSIQPCIHEQYLHAGRLWLVNVPSRLT